MSAAPARRQNAAELVARAQTENFPVALFVLSRAQRTHLMAIYGFARLADELGDSAPGRPARAARLARGGPRPGLHRRGSAPAAAAADADPAGARAAARAVRGADRGEPARPEDLALSDLARARRSTASTRRTRSGRLVLHVFGAADPGALRALRPGVHGAPARRALPGRGRRTSRAAACTCPPRTWCASARARRTLARERRRRRRCARCCASRSSARAACSRRAARWCARSRARARLAVAGFIAGGRAALDAIERADFDVLAAQAKPRPARSRAPARGSVAVSEPGAARRGRRRRARRAWPRRSPAATRAARSRSSRRGRGSAARRSRPSCRGLVGRQRPARVPALLHVVHRVPRADRRARAHGPAAAARDSRCSRPAAHRRGCAARALPAPLHLASSSAALRAALARPSACGSCPPALRLKSRRARRPAQRRA